MSARVRSWTPRFVAAMTTTCPSVMRHAIAERGRPRFVPVQPKAVCVTTGMAASTQLTAMPQTSITASTAITRDCLRKRSREAPSASSEQLARSAGSATSSISSQLTTRSHTTVIVAAAWNQPGMVSPPQRPASLVLSHANAVPSAGPQKRPCDLHSPDRTVHSWRSLNSQTSPMKIIVSSPFDVPRPTRLLATMSVRGERRQGIDPATA
mmetsp:Transcript_45910/g.143813  ORF Transcript_45910/g.143813 Transcript_45910/m.143813 type:complete len:210 (-) Transcript_45910:398-1027(-)